MDDVTVNVQNLGIAAINQYDIQYEILDENQNSLGISTAERFTTTIPSGGNINLTLSDQYVVPLGLYSIKAWVTFVGDSRATNDTTFSNGRGLRCNDARKYMDDFDGNNDWVTFVEGDLTACLLYTSPSPRDKRQSRMPSSA